MPASPPAAARPRNEYPVGGSIVKGTKVGRRDFLRMGAGAGAALSTGLMARSGWAHATGRARPI
ncbi:MAG: hypothetical protein DMF92_03845 [Acidobacteria bacterium]|nr:MAG: hypothetical protein DMF92_03845 [Acidobacteriota bacterium]